MLMTTVMMMMLMLMMMMMMMPIPMMTMRSCLMIYDIHLMVCSSCWLL